MRPLRIGTRGSALALWQARAVAAALERPGPPPSSSSSRRAAIAQQDAPLVGKSAARAVRQGDRGRAARAATSTSRSTARRTWPPSLPDGLAIAAVLPREDPRDALVLAAPSVSVARLRCGPAPRRCAARSAPAASGASRSCARIYPRRPVRADPRQRRHAAAQARRAARSTRWCSPAPACGGSGLADRISAAVPVDRLRAGARPGDHRDRDARRRRARRSAWQRRSTMPGARTALAAEQAVVAALGGGCQLPLGAIAEYTTAATCAIARRRGVARRDHGVVHGEARRQLRPRPSRLGTRLARARSRRRGAMEPAPLMNNTLRLHRRRRSRAIRR